MADPRVTVLVVEDSEADYVRLVELLRASPVAQYELLHRGSYAAGREAASAGGIDVALVAWHLATAPGRALNGGMEEEWGGLPVILVAPQLTPGLVAQAERAGAADCLGKEGLLLVQVEQAIRHARRYATTLQALRRSRQQLELFMWQVPCAVGICDGRGAILFQNGLSQEHFSESDFRRWLKPHGAGVPEVHVSRGKHWLVSTFPITGGDRVELLGVAGTDITSLVRSEAELRRTSRLLNAILGNLSVMAGRIAPDGTILEMRGRGLAEIGVREENLVGSNLTERYPELRAGFERALRGKATTVLWQTEHNGRRHSFENYLHADTDQGGVLSLAVNVTARIEAEEDRNRQSNLLGNVLKKLPVLVGQLDSAGRVVAVEGEGLEWNGFRPADLLGQELAAVHPDCRARVAQALAGEEVNFTLQGVHEGSPWYLDFHIAPYENGGATFFGRDVTERRWLERRLLMAADLEQRRIGADLHDGLGQKLTGLACLATAVRERTKRSDAEVAGQADTVARLANEAVQQARALARGLCPVELEEAGLVAALTSLVEQTRVLHEVDCEIFCPDESPPCEHPVSIHLYRITQEAITNAIRHAQARSIQVNLEPDGDVYRLIIRDDGAGFSVDDQLIRRSHGLRLMKFRATMIGASLQVTSQPGRGTRICCEFAANAVASPG